MNIDWISTILQSLPRFRSLLRQMRPSVHLPDISGIDRTFLAARGLEGIVWDVDGTLMSYHDTEVASEFREQVRGFFASGPGTHAILSNASEERFEILGKIFPEVPVLRAYRLDGQIVLRHLLEGRDTHTPEELEALRARGAKQIRKPDRALLDYALQCLNVQDPQKVVMVGDQYLTDVACANLAGTQSVKVATYRRDSFPLPIRLSQRIEVMLYRIRNGSPQR